MFHPPVFFQERTEQKQFQNLTTRRKSIMDNIQTSTTINVKKDFFDEDGELGFYVQNISNGKVCVSDLGVTVEHLGVSDLRERYGVDKLKNSPGLREAMGTKAKFLKRITRDEYEKLLALQNQREGRMDKQRRDFAEKSEKQALADSTEKIKEPHVDISPKVQSMVEKLRLHYRGQASSITPEDFQVYAENNKFTEDEKVYVLGIVKEPKIRQVIINQTEAEINAPK